VLGSWPALLLFLAVLASSASSLQATFLPPARTLLAMGSYQAIPSRFAHVHPRFKIPSYATLVCGIGTAVFYSIMTLLSQSVLEDTILTLGIMICFYYGLTAFAAVWFFRHQLFTSAFNATFTFAFPPAGRPHAGRGVRDLGDRQLRPCQRKRRCGRRSRAGVHSRRRPARWASS